MNDIIDEVIAWSLPLPLQPNEFTVRQFIDRVREKTGKVLDAPAARYQLEKLVTRGKLKKRPVVHNGFGCNAYSYTENRGIIPQGNDE